ncbi:gamma carbonic anhydrase family protein [Shimia aestuarii]|uniref:Carbonic anhydrase or acetyltransferase, isoleucine patch superfamily n=1 Tax=Shimia aestuarii TaxID=254406 RepID=A0A1I4T8U0_9RHOB|nr:gamma carbonic anhydrase family protein [Shimia aestuarii]SFM73109.1 Carbonic anhydrase or acetyltransferase, isoleucine patch superfamily [Shimia aestuarii]
MKGKCYSLKGKSPDWQNQDGVWIAPGAHVIGDVTLGNKSSVWFNAVIRGDNEPIVIGPRCNIQDLVTMHTDPGFPLILEANCTIGHRAILHGCRIGENSLVGMGAILLNGAQIGSNCLVGAGALVTEGSSFPDGSLIVGAPAKLKRALSPTEVNGLRASADRYVRKASSYSDKMRDL